MLIATFNCNSLRVRLPIILAWLQRRRPDVLATAPLASAWAECFVNLAPRQAAGASDHNVVAARFDI